MIHNSNQSLHHWREDKAKDRMWTCICIISACTPGSHWIFIWCRKQVSEFEKEIAVTACESRSNFSSWRQCNQCCLLSCLLHPHKDRKALAYTYTDTWAHTIYTSYLDQWTVLRKTQSRVCCLMCHTLSLQLHSSLISLLRGRPNKPSGQLQAWSVMQHPSKYFPQLTLRCDWGILKSSESVYLPKPIVGVQNLGKVEKIRSCLSPLLLL